MSAAIGKVENNMSISTDAGTTQRGALQAPKNWTELSVRTANTPEGVDIRVLVDGKEALQWTDRDGKRFEDGQYFGIALSDNNAKEHGERGPFSLLVDEVRVERVN